MGTFHAKIEGVIRGSIVPPGRGTLCAANMTLPLPCARWPFSARLRFLPGRGWARGVRGERPCPAGRTPTIRFRIISVTR